MVDARFSRYHDAFVAVMILVELAFKQIEVEATRIQFSGIKEIYFFTSRKEHLVHLIMVFKFWSIPIKQRLDKRGVAFDPNLVCSNAYQPFAKIKVLAEEDSNGLAILCLLNAIEGAINRLEDLPLEYFKIEDEKVIKEAVKLMEDYLTPEQIKLLFELVRPELVRVKANFGENKVKFNTQVGAILFKLWALEPDAMKFNDYPPIFSKFASILDTMSKRETTVYVDAFLPKNVC